jgi:hypothetical protein
MFLKKIEKTLTLVLLARVEKKVRQQNFSTSMERKWYLSRAENGWV